MFRFAAAPVVLLIASFALFQTQTQTPTTLKTTQAPSNPCSVGLRQERTTRTAFIRIL